MLLVDVNVWTFMGSKSCRSQGSSMLFLHILYTSKSNIKIQRWILQSNPCTCNWRRGLLLNKVISSGSIARYSWYKIYILGLQIWMSRKYGWLDIILINKNWKRLHWRQILILLVDWRLCVSSAPVDLQPIQRVCKSLKCYKAIWNFIQISTRICVERVFRFLKEKWRIIIKMADILLRHIIDIITICIALHNMYTIGKDKFVI